MSQNIQNQGSSDDSKLHAAAVSASASMDNTNQREKAEVPLRTKFKTAATVVNNHAKERLEQEKTDGADPSSKNKSTQDLSDDKWAQVGYYSKMTALKAKRERELTNEKLFSRVVVNSITWDVWSPPPGNSISGKVVPGFLVKHKHRRKCSLELHRVTPMEELEAPTHQEHDPQKRAHSYYECIVRILVPENKEMNRKVKQNALNDMANNNTSMDTFTSVRQIRYDDTDFNHHDDDATVNTISSVSSAATTKYPLLEDHGGREYGGWKPRYAFPMHGIFIRGQNKKTVTILISLNDFKQERDLIFDTNEDARSFIEEVEKQQRLENDRQEERLKFSLGTEIALPRFEKLDLLFEIVSAYNLPVADGFPTSDPYVSVFMGHQEVHRTDIRSNTLNPIWTLSTGSLFLLQVESRRFFIEDGLRFVVKDYDRGSKDEVLGICTVGPKTIYKANGERMEFTLTPAKKQQDDDDDPTRSTLVLRCRRATANDQKFMTEFAKNKTKTGVSSYSAPEVDSAFLKSLTTKVKKTDSNGETLYKIRPYPDPKRPPNETEWLSKKDIQKAVLEPSQQWVELGEGHLGKIYLEILGCDGLPNMDTGGLLGIKTDAFVACVFEDVYGRTDVINDCLSPRWPSWTSRAFILRIAHPSSVLNLGIFDYDNGVDSHDLIGRVSVDLTNFRSATEYVLSYNFCPSARISERKSNGKLMIRLRMEVDDERKLAMAALYPPPPIYVNTKNKKDFEVIQKTCFGSVDEDRYSVSTLKSYIDELYDLQHVLFHIEDGLTTLLLWRGQMEMTIPYFDIEMDVPVHSILAFILSTFLVEHPVLIPSFCFGTLAWLLLAIGSWRQSSENVWKRTHSYSQIFKMIALGDDYAEPHRIKPFENFKEAKKEAEDWVKRIEDYEENSARLAEEAEQAEMERQRELDEVGTIDTEIATKANQSGIARTSPVRAALYPIQIMLGILVRAIRIISNVLSWQEAYISFWVTTCSLGLAIISLFVPWLWCLKWGSRIFAWTVFGPWMKLVDIYYVSLIEEESDEERERRKQEEKLAQKLQRTETATQANITRENTAKLKAMKEYLFGKLSIRVPILKQDRYQDVPLAESFATPYQEKNFSLAELAIQEAGYNKTRVSGQTLVGDMIPYVKEESFTQAPVGKATLHPEKLSRNTPGSNGGIVTNSRKIMIAFGLAIGITYYGTTLLVDALTQIDEWLASAMAPVSTGEL